MRTIKDFLQWYNVKDVEPTLKAMQKMMQSYHSKSVDFMKLGCTLPSIANRVLHNSTDKKFFFLEQRARICITSCERILWADLQSCLPAKLLLVKRIFAIPIINVKQLRESMQVSFTPMQCRRRCQLDNIHVMISTRKNVCLYYDKIGEHYSSLKFCITSRKITRVGKFLLTTVRELNIELAHISWTGFVCSTIFEAMGCYYHGCECMSEKITSEEIKKREKRQEHDRKRKEYLSQKGYTVVEMWECQFRTILAENLALRQELNSKYPKKQALSESQLVSKIRNGTIFGYIQCDIEVPQELRHKFADFPPIFKNTEVGRADIGSHMESYAVEHNELPKPRRMLISSFYQKNGSFITPMAKFLLELGAVITHVYRFVQYQPDRCFAKFVQDVVDSRRAGDENSSSAVQAETMKLLGNSSYGYQLLDRRKHKTVQYAADDTIHKLINKSNFHSYDEITDSVYEVTMSKKTILHKDPIVLGYFILQYAKLRMLELYYNFLDRFCDKIYSRSWKSTLTVYI